MKKFLSSLLLALTVIITASPARAALPDGYTELEYIESSGTQYIDTGYIPNEQGFLAKGRLRFVGTQNNWASVLGQFPGQGGTAIKTATKFGRNNNTYYWSATFGRDETSQTTFELDTDYDFEISFIVGNKYLKINGDTVINSTDDNTVYPQNIYVFSYNRPSFLLTESFKGRIYNLSLYDNTNVLQANLVPARRNSDDVLGMYDTVSGTFFTNAGTDEFIAGPVAEIKIATTAYNAAAFAPVEQALESAVTTIKDVVANTIVQADAIQNLQDTKQTRPDEECPAGRLCLLVEDVDGSPHWYPIIERAPGLVPANSGYTQVEYLQSDGHQYIDAGITTKNTEYKIESVFNIKGVTDTEAWAVGMWAGAMGNSLRIGVGNNGQWYVQNTTQTYNPNAFALDTKTSATATGTVLAGQKFGIGALYHYQRGFEQTSNIALYSARIYENGDMLRDFVPARRDSDGVLGMYDTVSGTFFTNAGTGEFTAPGYLPTSYTRLQSITANGTQYIDTGVVMSNDVEFTANVGTTGYNAEGIYVDGAGRTGLVVWQNTYSFNFRYYTAPGVTNTQTTTIPFTLNTMYNVGFNINKSSFSVDGQSIAKNQTIYNTGATIRTGLKDITAGLKIWDNGTLVRDFVPARDSSNVVGLYDLVNNQFYTNAGTGTFTAGPAAQ